MSETLTVTVDDGGTYTVDVKGVSLFTDAGLTTPATFPVSVSADTTWYAAAPSRAGRRDNIEVVVTTSVGTRIPVETFNGLPVTVNLTEGTVDYSAPAPSTASAPAGSPVVRAFPFTFDTPGLVTGAAVYTPTVGDVLLDAWVQVHTGWDGTTPLFDFGPFTVADGGLGWFASTALPIDISRAESNNLDADTTLSTSLQRISTLGPFTTDRLGELNFFYAQVVNPANPGTTSVTGIHRITPAVFAAANPIKVCVSQDGSSTGADPGATQGAATLYLVTATPAT